MPRSTVHASSVVIYFAFAASALFIWFIAFFVTGWGTAALSDDAPADPAMFMRLYVAIAVLGLGVALYMRRRAQRMALTGAASPDRVMTTLIIAWGVLETVAMAGAVLFMLTASAFYLYIAAGTYVLGMVLAFPSSNLFLPDRETA